MGLIIPASHRIHDEAPKFACTICEKVFTRDERHQFERHVLSHTPDELKPHSPRLQAPGIFDPYHESGDVEWQRWIDENAAAGNDPMKYMRTSDGKS